MIAGNELHVFVDGKHAGVVERTAKGRTSFTYDTAYQKAGTSVPLSFSMPKEVSEHPPKKINAFLAGLVPERPEAKERIRKQYGLTSTEPFALLKAVGRDTAGAIQILPPEEASSDAAVTRGDITRLTQADLIDLITDLAANPLEWDPGKYRGRWSLAGAQSKVALFQFEDGGWGVPNDSTPTTHILKPAIAGYAHHEVNEYLSMRAATGLGLTTARTDVLEVEGAPAVLLSTRYDRKNKGGAWTRLHQEDMCQALAVLPERKYQADGGPGVAHIADVLAQLDRKKDRDRSARLFFNALVFNVSAACTDAHAKNFSLLLTAEGQTLAPLYDIATHTPYPAEGPLLSAMKIGDEYQFDKIGMLHLLKASRKLGIPDDEAVNSIERIRSGVAAAYADAAAPLNGHPVFGAAATRIANAVHESVTARGWVGAARHATT